jgi:hypothetical protein
MYTTQCETARGVPGLFEGGEQRRLRWRERMAALLELDGVERQGCQACSGVGSQTRAR